MPASLPGLVSVHKAPTPNPWLLWVDGHALRRAIGVAFGGAGPGESEQRLAAAHAGRRDALDEGLLGEEEEHDDGHHEQRGRAHQ